MNSTIQSVQKQDERIHLLSILLVEDDECMRLSISETLSILGYNVLVASDGKRAIETFKEEKIDLIITDIFMPDMDGIEVIRKISQINPNTKIIAVSGKFKFGEEMLEYSLKLGANAILKKPFTANELHETILSLIK